MPSAPRGRQRDRRPERPVTQIRQISQPTRTSLSPTASGTRAITVVPRFAPGSTVRLPPSNPTRSRIPSSPRRRLSLPVVDSASNPRPSSSITAVTCPFPLEDNAHPPRGSVLKYVRQRLLHHAVQGRLNRRGQTRPFKPDAMKIDLDPRPLRPAVGVVRQGRLKAMVIQRRRPKLQGQVVNLSADQVGQCLKALEAAPAPGTSLGSRP